MENTLTDTRPRFARLTENRAARSWTRAVPAVVVIVALIALVGYLASSISSSSQRAMAAERDAQQTREAQAGLTRQIADLQKDDALAKSPGRTTIVIEPDKKSKSGDKAWAAVTWGELPTGKSFMRVNAYGLAPKLDGNKNYHVWFQPQSGDPIDIGQLEGDMNGSGFATISTLPAIDQGKSVMLTADAPDAKQPGDVLAKAELPKLKPTMQVAPPAANDQPQAKTGSTSQQMHQEQPANQPGK